VKKFFFFFKKKVLFLVRRNAEWKTKSGDLNDVWNKAEEEWKEEEEPGCKI
jgi:hypothetical protein